jgi:hypothetical protein
MHAFHALVWRPEARRCWADTFRFLGEHLNLRADREGNQPVASAPRIR